jgi:O-antigen/teichoic acid export membrane protein
MTSTSSATTPADAAEAGARAGGRRLASGVVWNAAGRGLPLLLALALTPVLVAQMGLDRWGLFTLALAMVGVFGVFDLGVGQALTRTIAERIGAGRGVEAPALVGAAIATLLGISAAAAAALWVFVPVLVERVLRVPPALQPEAVAAMRVLAAAAPLVVVNAALWGVLAAYQRFRAANLATIPVSIFYYLGPVLTLLVWDSLVGVMLALVACRLANTLSYAWLARGALPPGPVFRGLRIGLVGPLLRLGGWMTFAGVLTQALLYADRFLIGALVSLTAVAFYATPLDLVLRAWILPVAVAQALLPAMASVYVALPRETAGLLRRGALLVMALVLPACLGLVAGARELLWLWLGAEFAAGGAMVLRILAVGIFFSCVAFAPAALLDAIGRPDATARFALAQAVVFLPLSALLLLWAGIEGAAAAWALRAAVDCGGKLLLAARLYPPATEAVRRVAAPLAGAGLGLLGLLAAAAAGGPWPAVAAVVAAALLGFAPLALRALDPAERRDMGALLRDPRAALRPTAAGTGGRTAA